MLNFQSITVIGILTAVIAFFGQIKAQILRFSQFFIRTDSSTILRTEFLNEMLKDSKIIRYGNLTLSLECAFNKKDKLEVDFLMREEASLILLYKKYIPIIIKPSNYTGFSVTYLYGTLDFEAIISKIFADWAKDSRTDCNFWVDNVYGREVSSEEIRNNSLGSGEAPKLVRGSSGDSESMFKYNNLTNKAHVVGVDVNDLTSVREKINKSYYWSAESQKLYEDVEFWKNSKHWFTEKGLPWKRSALLYGCPGGGKSKAVLEIAKKLGLFVKSFHLSSMSSKEFCAEFERDSESGNIILIEDIDSVFDGRENVSPQNLAKQALSFDDLINAISGVGSFRSKKYIIITTNHPEKLDPALKRAGRLDLHVEFKQIDEKGRAYIANNLLCEWPQLVEETKTWPEMPVCDFENKCVELAVNQYWKEKRNENRINDVLASVS